MRLILLVDIYHGHDYRPKSGLRQGCPLSPLFFSLLISPPIQQLQTTAILVRVLVYADDAMLIFNCCSRRAHKQTRRCLPIFHRFAPYTGLKANFDKLHLIPKGEWTPEQKQFRARTGMKVKDSAKYLGMKFGEVTPQQAFAPAIQKAMLRALAMHH